MALAKCPKHGFSSSIAISKELKEIALRKEKLNHLVMLVYEYEYEYDPGDINCRLYYFFSPNESEKLNIPDPGLILRFNINAKDEPEDPYELVIRNISAMCSKCFSETYDDLVKNVMSKYEDIKVLYLGYS
jgi:hypothetical protein